MIEKIKNLLKKLTGKKVKIKELIITLEALLNKVDELESKLDKLKGGK